MGHLRELHSTSSFSGISECSPLTSSTLFGLLTLQMFRMHVD